MKRAVRGWGAQDDLGEGEKGMSQDRYDVIRNFLTDQNFIELRRRADQGVLLWSDFLKLPLPEGLTREEVWDILNIVRRQTATELPWDTFLDKSSLGKGWFTTTRALADALKTVEGMLSSDSVLSSIIAEKRSAYPLVALVQRELSTACMIDGFPVSEERVRDVLRGAVGHRDRADTLISNFVKTYALLENWVDRPLTVGLIEEIHMNLIQGLEGLRPEPLAIMARMSPESVYNDPFVALRTIVDISFGGNLGEDFHPVLRMLHMKWLFLIARPFPHWNCLVELLVRTLFLMQQQYLGLMYIPLGYLQWQWSEGAVKNVRKIEDYIAYLPQYNDDLTPRYLAELNLVIDEIDDLERLVNQLVQRDKDLQESLNDSYLNYRQRAIIANALNSPHTPQRIEAHRRSYRVVYATARADFMNLVEQGYLVQESQGKAFTFYPGPKLQERLDRV